VSVLQPKDQKSLSYWTEENYYRLDNLQVGEYTWTVSVVRSTQGELEPVSEESRNSHFHIPPPPPVVLGISPTSMVEGAGGQVTVNGENITSPITLIIGVPLQSMSVNSSTITATIPITLEAGLYTVTMQDSMGRKVSSTTSFTVVPPPTPSPAPVYAPPTLGFGGIIDRNVTLRWQWDGTLARDEWFAVRVGKLPDEPHSLIWTKERQYTFVLSEMGDYVWEVAICRGDPSEASCRDQLGVSNRNTFSLQSWNPQTPIPTQPPDYNPNVACVVSPCAPAPRLYEPENDALFISSSYIELRWEWDYCLPPEWKFAIRFSDVAPPHSIRYEDNPLFITCLDGKAFGQYIIDQEFTVGPGVYYWNIAVVRSVEGGWERLSEDSEVRRFRIVESPARDAP